MNTSPSDGALAASHELASGQPLSHPAASEVPRRSVLLMSLPAGLRASVAWWMHEYSATRSLGCPASLIVCSSPRCS
eukprot:8901880-Alexandrium_andersonii.AAC.1